MLKRGSSIRFSTESSPLSNKAIKTKLLIYPEMSSSQKQFQCPLPFCIHFLPELSFSFNFGLFKNCLIKRRMKPHYFEFYTILGNANFCVGMRFTGQGFRKVSKPLDSTNTIIRPLTNDFFSGDKLFLFGG